VGKPKAHRLLGVERAAALLRVPPFVLRAWDRMDFGPAPVLRNRDGTAAAWSREGLAAWSGGLT